MPFFGGSRSPAAHKGVLTINFAFQSLAPQYPSSSSGGGNREPRTGDIIGGCDQGLSEAG
jgi:hypothetical protein